MNVRAPIPLLIDAVESALFPESTKLAQQRRAHYRGCEFARHYRARAASAGVRRAALQLRKQGLPLAVALSVLAFRR